MGVHGVKERSMTWHMEVDEVKVGVYVVMEGCEG